MMSPDERLVYMAEQIARNFAAQGDERAVPAVADHIATFWDPDMRRRLLATTPERLGPIATRAVALLRDRGAPEHQTLATADRGGSDAG